MAGVEKGRYYNKPPLPPKSWSNINHYEISWQNQWHSSASPDTQKYRTCVWGPWGVPICARQHTKGYLTSPLELSQRWWSTVHSTNTSTERGSRTIPGLRTCCCGCFHRMGHPLQRSWPPQSWQPAKSGQCLLPWERRIKWSYFI